MNKRFIKSQRPRSPAWNRRIACPQWPAGPPDSKFSSANKAVKTTKKPASCSRAEPLERPRIETCIQSTCLTEHVTAQASSSSCSVTHHWNQPWQWTAPGPNKQPPLWPCWTQQRKNWTLTHTANGWEAEMLQGEFVLANSKPKWENCVALLPKDYLVVYGGCFIVLKSSIVFFPPLWFAAIHGGSTLNGWASARWLCTLQTARWLPPNVRQPNG